jgi:tripartite-type tricarboxylate transporter receptor subunit TctC
VVNPVIYSLPYDVQTDFEPITLIASNPHFIVAKKANPANDLKRVHRVAQGQPGQGDGRHRR